MKVMDESEGREWLARQDWEDVNPVLLASRFKHSRRFHIPGDAGRKTALARELAGVLDRGHGETMLWISDYGIWPSSENLELFNAYRRSLGESRTLDDAPYHLLSRGDRVVLECLLDLILYFSWDAVLLPASLGLSVALSHDEHLSIYADDASTARIVETVVASFIAV